MSPSGSDGSGGIKIGERVSNYMELLERGADKKTLSKAQEEIASQLKDRFKQNKNLPKFLKKAAQSRRHRLQLRLSNRKRIVQDRRARLKHAKVKKSRTGRTEVRRTSVRSEGTEQSAARQRTTEMLSRFERAIIARFEQGQQLGQKLPKGTQAFSLKSAAQWAKFFGKQAGRSVFRKASMEDIKQMIFRGLVLKGGKGAAVSDLMLTSGRLEKFIRFKIMPQLAAMLAKLKPGEGIPKEMLKMLGSEELLYLALAAKKGEAYKTQPKAMDGKFMGALAEERAAQELGLPLDSQLQEKARQLKKGKGGMFGGMFGADREPEDLPHKFVPWWHWGDLPKKGRWKSARVLFYLAILTAALIGIGVMTMRLLGG